MIGTILEPTKTALNLKTVYPVGTDELERGQVEGLLEQLRPLVAGQNVTLDLGRVERIDAAGIAALVELYRSAQATGHCFKICKVQERVKEILALVGLEPYFDSHNAVQNSHCADAVRRPAA